MIAAKMLLLLLLATTLDLPEKKVWFESKTAKELHLKEVPGEEYGILNAENLPPLKSYSLYMQNGLQKSYYLGEVHTNKKGKAFFKGKNLQSIPLNLHPLIHRNFMLGERVFYYLFPDNSREPLVVSVSPRALFHQWQDGATIELFLLNKCATQFQLQGTRLQPNEQLFTLSMTSDVVTPGTLTANENGSFSMILSPEVPGKKGGESSITIQRTATEDSYTLHYLWGAAAQDEVNQAKQLPPPPAPNSLPAIIESPAHLVPDFSESDCVKHLND